MIFKGGVAELLVFWRSSPCTAGVLHIGKDREPIAGLVFHFEMTQVTRYLLVTAAEVRSRGIKQHVLKGLLCVTVERVTVPTVSKKVLGGIIVHQRV